MLYELATLLLDRDWKRHQYVTDISALMFTAALAMITHTHTMETTRALLLINI